MNKNIKKAVSFVSLVALTLAYAPGALSETSSDFITNVRVGVVTETSAKILWDTQEIANTAAVYYGTLGDLNNTSYDICSSNEGIDVTQHCIELHELTHSTDYYYTVEVVAGAGTLLQSDGHTFVTPEGDTTETDHVPEAPSHLAATISTTGMDIVLNWQDNSDNEDRFEIYYVSPDLNNYSLLADVGANGTEYVHASLSPGSYEYKVRACNIGGECSAFTGIASTHIETEETIEDSTEEDSVEEDTNINEEEEKLDDTSTVSHTEDADKETTLKTEDRVEIKAPANSVSDSGTVTLTVEEDTEEVPAPDTDRKVVGSAYELQAKDDSGNLITQFRSEVTVTLPYREGDISLAGGTEDTIAIYFWNESLNIWEKLESSTVDKKNNSVSADTTHFTRFAILADIFQEDLSGIVDGDLIKTANNPDIYIAKFVGPKKYKRLILNPEIFNSYGHLEWENVKVVTQAQVDAFFLSELTMEVYADGSPVNGHVYTVSSSPNSDLGTAQRLDITPAQFEKKGFDWEGIFKINHFEASPDFYTAGPPITA